MMRTFLPSVVLLALIPLGAIQAADPPAGAKPSERLRAVIAAYWDDFLKRHPLEATIYVGDHHYDDRLNDPSLEAYAAWLAQLRKTRLELEAIEPQGLSPSERIDREILAGMIDDRVELEKFGGRLIPVIQLVRASTDVHTDDLHLVFSQLGDFHPASTAGDLENFDRRLHAFPKLAEGLIAVMRQGMAAKRLPPKLITARVVAQLRALANPKAEESPLWTIVNRLPKDWPETEKKEAVERIRKAIEESVIPAYAKFAAFVEKEYLPACPENVGLCDAPDGLAHYARLVRRFTTTDLTPDQIHETGLAQVAKTREGMEVIRKKIGFDGDLKAFLVHVRADPKLKNRDAQSILDGHRAILAAMDANLPKLFGKLPTTPYEVREFDPVRAKSSPSAEYLPVPSDGSRPGIFFVNTSDPTSRPTYIMQALAYHEAVPGHHFQMSLSLEDPGRPIFRRYFYIPAFDEGWALYSEGLPAEIGLYTDPYAEFGRLNYDALRCVRLVIDTGIHAKGWSRDRAIAYFEANTSLPRNEIANETDRYIAWPGQALAYKVGELTIRAARAKAELRDGPAFDLRAFHDRLLGSGSVPLRLLDRVLDKK